MVSRSIPADHKDLIHDIAYDFYGRRLATCSSDQSVKVWDKGNDGEWHCTSSWKTHAGSVWKVTWAHPEFGQILATCSFDRTAILWEEMMATDNTNSGERHQSVWIKRHSFVQSRSSVTDIKFAPREYGLILVTCSLEGSIRIYEAPDVMNITNWSNQYEISCGRACSSVTWNPSLFRGNCPMIAIGSDDSSPTIGSKILIYELNEHGREHGWHKIWTGVDELVFDIAFAPNNGRSFDLLGVATAKDVKIISITQEIDRDTNNANSNKRHYKVQVIASLTDHGCQAWRVSWNITGTILASSGDDGAVRLWKALQGQWKSIGAMKPDETQYKDLGTELNGLTLRTVPPGQ